MAGDSATRNGAPLTQQQMIAMLRGVLLEHSQQNQTPQQRFDAEAMRAMGINRADGTPLTLAQLAIMMGRLNANQLAGNEQGRSLLSLKDLNGQRIFDSGKKRRANGCTNLRVQSSQTLVVRAIMDARRSLREQAEDKEDAAKEAIKSRSEAVDAEGARAHGTKAERNDSGERDHEKHENDTNHGVREGDKASEEKRRRELEESAKLQQNDQIRLNAALLTAQQLREQKDRETKERIQKDEKDRKNDEDNKRRRYVVKDRDTLQSIALRQLRDARLATLIYQINRSVIPVTLQRGKQVHNLKPGQVILLPSGLEVRDFRSRRSAVATPEVSKEQKFASAEQELESKFGANWSGSKAEQQDFSPITNEARTRRENVERLLGPVAKEEPSARIKYIVRLGDTLKSVAMKHPGMQDVALWKLLGDVNNVVVTTDEKGLPVTKLSRGSMLLIPTPTEIAEFREKNPKPIERLKPESGSDCVKCGAESLGTICSACGLMTEPIRR